MARAGYEVATLRGANASGEAVGLEIDEAVNAIKEGGVELVMTSGDMHGLDYWIRRTAADLNVPLVLSSRLGRELANALELGGCTSVKEIDEYSQ